MSQQINPSILDAAVGLLRPYCPTISPEALDNALRNITSPATPEIRRPEKPYSRKEAAALLQVSLNTVNRYMNAGLLRKISVGPRHVLIDPASLRRLLAGVAHD